jgi:hypothetical protein
MDNESFPAGTLICARSEDGNVAFVEMKNLDGETNLKAPGDLDGKIQGDSLVKSNHPTPSLNSHFCIPFSHVRVGVGSSQTLSAQHPAPFVVQPNSLCLLSWQLSRSHTMPVRVPWLLLNSRNSHIGELLWEAGCGIRGIRAVLEGA